MSESADKPQRVVPAQLSFLAIYNPSLGKTDETVREQIVYYSSREQRDGKRHEKHQSSEDGLSDEAENERLRQVGLAQGMVDFVKNFSNDAPVDSIETEKSRLVLHEVESGWWILASIDLTRLPSARTAIPGEDGGRASVEYSSREVSPSQLMVKQLIQAHSIFLLHHAPSLQDLFSRLGRVQFCSLLERFWDTFTRDWDVLLHGNPAVDIYNGVKLAGGGELGVGVGEEEWGSGEREVLEDFIVRTEGLVDLVVSRFGDAPVEPTQIDGRTTAGKARTAPEPWLGTDSDGRSSDGVIFSGAGAISRRSLATVSQWIEAIFKTGEAAFGVGENPSSRHRRKKRKTTPKPSNNHLKSTQATQPRPKSPRGRDPDLRRKAIGNNAGAPGIPPPLVSAVERSLDQATVKVKSREQSTSPRQESSEVDAVGDPSIFGTDNMMKYLKLGYGSSWTLSPAGLTGSLADDSKSSSFAEHSNQAHRTKCSEDHSAAAVKTERALPLQEVDPTPELSDDEETPFVQRLEQSIGKFVIGLIGDLENLEFDLEEDYQDKSRSPTRAETPRVLLRTITVEMSDPQGANSKPRPGSRISNGMERKKSYASASNTSAGNSVDGAHANISHQKLQVAVYVHQPFIFVFLFELHTPSLTIPAFYRNIHHQLGPLQKPLLKSTDPAKTAERIAEAMGERASTTSPVQAGATGPAIYDVIYDPLRLTIRTSVPNIPVPGSLAAEGLSSHSSSLTVSGSWYTLGIPISGGSSTSNHEQASSLIKMEWTRVEALNVHTQILNTWAATRFGSELERTVKTGRGWWVLWMQVPSMSGNSKEAFLIRKAANHRAVGGKGRESTSGRWLLRERSRDISGSSTQSGRAGGTTTMAGVSEGVGVDARKWVDGLLHFI